MPCFPFHAYCRRFFAVACLFFEGGTGRRGVQCSVFGLRSSVRTPNTHSLDTAQQSCCIIAIMDAETRVEAPFGDWLMRKLRERDMSLSDVARLAQCDYTY